MNLNEASSIEASIKQLKAKQQSCTQLLVECVNFREENPQFAARADVVIASIEAMMSQTAELLAQLESNVRINPAKAS
jgi:hypothetical protein